MTDDQAAFSVRVTGRVHGAGFREWTRHEASGLGLTGWVRNEPDGSVAALLVGPAGAVATMLERLQRGPGYAEVASVEREVVAIAERPTGFRVTR